MKNTDSKANQINQISQQQLSLLVKKARKKYKIPAIVVMLINSKEIYLQEFDGVRVANQPKNITLNDYFHIGSCSKSVLAVIAAKLIEQNKITWQTKFFDVFFELRPIADKAYSDITLQDLFLCEAGIQAYTDSKIDVFPEYGSSVNNKRFEFIKKLITQPPASEFNGKNSKFGHLYSNASYTMASAMLERVAGLNYEQLVKKAMNNDLDFAVLIGWPNNFNADQPWGHTIAKGKIELFPPDHPYKLPFLITPAGDLSMKPVDYAKYTQLHLRGLRGEDNYISSESYRFIHFGRTGFSIGVGNGVMSGIKFSGLDGSAGTFYCRSIIVPESDFAFTIMMNAGSGTASMKAVEWLTMQIVKRYYNWQWKFWM